ncbi:MAG: phosphatase PAP2 family protein [Bdellovibrionales bacterium]|nr:phosphatase PAP2 family protein [Bdellovibrionales bacterium]
MIRNLCILFLIFSSQSASFAADSESIQSLNGQNSEGVETEASFWQQRKAEAFSPWQTEARPYLIYGSLVTAAILATKHNGEDQFNENMAKDQPLGDAAEIGDLGGQGFTNLFYIAGMGGHYYFTKSQKSYDHMTTMLLATAYAVGTSSILKFIVHEPRPNDRTTYNSFPSGHTTSAFAFSSVIIAEHGFWPWGFAATALATLTGISRVNDHKHYLHDVTAGFTIGSAYGFGISYLRQGQQLNKHAAGGASSHFYVMPVFAKERGGLVAYYEY